mgnify:CR=1 FL=1
MREEVEIMKKFWNLKKTQNNIGELYLYSEIADTTWWGDETTPKQFKEELDSLGDIDTLNVYINSPGGDVFAGITIYNMLKRHPATKNVYIDGLAASIASVIAMAGDSIIMPKNAMMMIHKAWGVCIGNANDMRKFADDLEKIEESIVESYMTKASISEDEIKSMMDAETWLSAEECYGYGLCTEVVEEKKMAACISDKFMKNYKNVPKQLVEPPQKEEAEQVEEINNFEVERLRLELAMTDSFLLQEKN